MAPAPQPQQPRRESRRQAPPLPAPARAHATDAAADGATTTVAAGDQHPHPVATGPRPQEPRSRTAPHRAAAGSGPQYSAPLCRRRQPEDLPGPSATGRRSVLDPYKPYLQARIDEGVTATSVLLQEISARGYRGGERTLRRWLIDARQHHEKPAAPPPPPASRAITGWIMRPTDSLSERRHRCAQGRLHPLPRHRHHQRTRVRLHPPDPPTRWRTTRGLDRPSRRRTDQRDPRLRQRPTQGLRRRQSRTHLAWSSGAVEGAVNRIKMIKRQMYGRANLDLLRKRILVRDHQPTSIII
jgi:hypothetical protein